MKEIEKLSAEIHKVYCEEYKKRFGKEYFTGGDYSLLDEPTKNYDRNLAHWHLNLIQKERERCAKIAEGINTNALDFLLKDGDSRAWMTSQAIAKAIREQG